MRRFGERRAVGGFGGGGDAPATPATILGSALLQWCRSDLGITIGTGVSAWADQSAGAKHYTQGTGAAQPSYSASDATLGNRPSLTFDATDDYLQSALQLPAPGTTPSLLWMILKQNAWTLNNNVVSGDGSIVIRQSSTSPQVRVFNGVLGPVSGLGVIGTWVRLAAYITNSVNDYIVVKGSGVLNGTNTGNQSDATAVRRIGTNAAVSTFTSITVAEIVYANSDAQLAALDAYGTALYGSGPFT